MIKQNGNIHSDSIHIHGLRLKCFVGVTAKERDVRQIISADLTLKCDLCRAGKSDALRDTVDYAAVAAAVRKAASGGTFALLESLAERIAAVCLSHPMVKETIVKASKIGVLRDVKRVEVEIVRQRDRRHT